MTDPATWLYYALSTIAQCAAALAALIGFLGLWRLDRLQEEQSRIFQLFHDIQVGSTTDNLVRYGNEYYVQRAKERIVPESALARAVARYDALPGAQRRFLWVVRGFLLVTLIILGAAVVGFLYVDRAATWAWTPRLLWLAAILLAGGPIGVVFTAAQLPRAPVLLLLLGLAMPALATPALAGGTRCTTYHQRTMDRWQTICSDGTRAISTYNRTMDRWETTVTESPRQACTGQLNPRTQAVEIRCR